MSQDASLTPFTCCIRPAYGSLDRIVTSYFKDTIIVLTLSRALGFVLPAARTQVYCFTTITVAA